MYTVDLFSTHSLFNFYLPNLDYKTESFSFQYYLYYFLNHSQDCFLVNNLNNEVIGYMIGKHEGLNENFHTHITALSVAPTYRKLGVANKLIKYLEFNGNKNDAYFVDLFVRKTNQNAIMFYLGHKYIVYRTILDYYLNPSEDAYDMRKKLLKDEKGLSIIPLKEPVKFSDIDD